MPTKGDNLPPILPVGTAVVARVAISAAGEEVCPAGAVGTVIESPADPRHSYRVRFPGGAVTSMRRDQLQVLRQFTDPAAPEALAEHGLWDHVIYRCVVGSRAYGLDRDESDVDRRGIYLPPAELHWSLWGVPGQLEDARTDEVYWELGKFLRLALKANPNVLEVLHSPLVELARPPADELLEIRGCFLSKLVYQTYNGYVLSQFKKLEQDLRNRGEVRNKHAMHLVRLLLAGIEILRTGQVPVRVEAHREKLLAIRDGEMDWPAVDAWRLELHRQFDAAYETTPLPDRPDYERANDFLVRARKGMVQP